MKQTNSLRQRLLSALLALVCVLGLLPASAFAASPGTIKMDDCAYSGTKYDSPALGECYLHQMHFGLNGKSTMGFCAEKGKGMGWSLKGHTWGNPKPISDPTVKTMMKNFVSINHRVAGSMNNRIAYFLADDKRRIVLATSEEWKIMLKTKEKFIQDDANIAQVEPEGGGDILALLRPYVNLSNDDFRLLVIWLIQAYSRQSSHYALVISSSRGTGKSTLTKLLRSLIDPSHSDASLTPSSNSDLKNLLANTIMACFDNTAALTEDYSNILCAAITGAKEAKRKLYSNCDQIILNLHNIVVLNGIDILPKKSDLIERSLLFELKKIPNDKRKTDYEFWRNFEADKPAILGAVFDTLQKAMQILPNLKVTRLERMADAYKEMLAVALALDIPQDEFQRIFSANQGRINTSYMQNDPFIRAVVNYVERNKHIDKSATAVYEELSKSIVGKCKNFPGDVSALSKRLNEEKDTLLDLGIHFHRRMRSSYSYITLDKIAPSKLTKKQKERQAQWAAQFSDEDASSEE